MSRKVFTDEEIAVLKANPYVKRITPLKIGFTIEFKERFWEECQQGRSNAAIVKDMGFDPDVLGRSRLEGISRHIKETAGSGEEFREDYRTRGFAKDATQLPPSSAMVQLQHEITYIKQELEFIKKTISLDKEARRKCSSEAKRGPNSGSSKK